MPRAIGIGIGTAFGGGVIEPPFSPLDLSPSVWLDASDTSTITESSGAVSEWRDKSGNGRHVSNGTAASQPTTGANTQNGLNVIGFDGSNDFLDFADIPSVLTTEVTVFAVVIILANQFGGIITSSFQSTDNTCRLVVQNTGKVAWQPKQNSQVETSAAVSSWAYLSARSSASASTAELWRNGVSQGAIIAVGLAGTRNRIGTYRREASNFANMRLGELIVYPSALSAGDRQSVESFLATKWGL